MEERVYNQLKGYLLQFKKGKSIDLDTLQSQMSGEIHYEQFAHAMKRLEQEGVLKPVKSSGTNRKSLELANRYHFFKQFLQLEANEGIKDCWMKLKSKKLLSLDSYFRLPYEQFNKDLDYIQRIDDAIVNQGLPTAPMPLPALSFLLSNDEKWIQEKGGKALLKRIKLWDHLVVQDTYEPLAFAINPQRLKESEQYHLIVENKTPYLQLLEGLQDAPFTTLIYGAGWKVTSGIPILEKQLGTGEGTKHVFYYFGDLDHEGLHIWYRTNALMKTHLAMPFYQALLAMEPAIGKTNQRIHQPSVQQFANYFTAQQQQKIKATLSSDGYYPQEALPQKQLIEILQAWTVP